MVTACVTDLWPAPGQSSAPALIGWEVCRAGAVSEGAGLQRVAVDVETNRLGHCLWCSLHQRYKLKLSVGIFTVCCD